AAQRWDGDGADTTAVNLGHQGAEPCVYVLQATLATPVALGREANDVTWRRELVGVEHEHPARLHLFTLAGRLVSLEVLRPHILELQGNATAHYTDTVHGVDDGFGVIPQDVAAGKFDHDRLFTQ